MKRTVILSVVAVALLAAVPVWAAPPFGSFGGIVGGGNSGAGLLPLHGWALDDDGILAVDILVDGRVAGRASLKRARAGVTARFPGFPDSALPGFAFELDTTRYLNGLHTVTARVKSKSGEVVNLQSRTFQFHNLEHSLLPFGHIEAPARQAELRGKCNLANPNRRFSVISGYALDAGTQNDDHGIGYVELLIDRAVVENSQTDCFFSTLTGGLTNCYGLRRTDIERIFPTLKDSPHSGFRFVIDIGFLIEAVGFTPGSHVLTVRAADHANQVRNIDEIQVTFSCDEDGANENSFGAIDQPSNGMLHHGVIQVSGWALDWEGITSVGIFVDGHPVGLATLGFPRPDVSSLHLGFPESAAPGWRFSLDTRLFANGEHFIDVVVRDDLGVETFIGKRRFVINNVGG
jgi:N-acetylmuramoyl-L-alanine amidase